MNVMYILRGLPGSGKTTFAYELAKQARSRYNAQVEHCSADFFFNKAGGVYDFSPLELGHAHDKCLRDAIHALLYHVDNTKIIIVDNTNTTVLEMAPYYAVARALGARVVIVKLNGEFENTHGVPVEKVERMAEHFDHWLPNYWIAQERFVIPEDIEDQVRVMLAATLSI